MAIRDLIQRKNEAYQALENADRHLMKRERAHRLGQASPAPINWLERRRELQSSYDRVLAALETLRRHTAELERQNGGGGDNL